MVVKRDQEINRTDVCLAGTIKDNTCPSHNEPRRGGPAGRRNVAVQQLEDVVEFQAQRLLALRRHMTHLMMRSDMSGNCE